MKINYPAVIVAAILHWILGAVWYGVFSSKFIELMAWTPAQIAAIESQSHTKDYILAFLSSLVLTYILAHFVQYTKAVNISGGLQTAFWLWLGFVVTTQLPTVLFEGRKPGLYLLHYGNRRTWRPPVEIDSWSPHPLRRSSSVNGGGKRGEKFLPGLGIRVNFDRNVKGVDGRNDRRSCGESRLCLERSGSAARR